MSDDDDDDADNGAGFKAEWSGGTERAKERNEAVGC